MGGKHAELHEYALNLKGGMQWILLLIFATAVILLAWYPWNILLLALVAWPRSQGAPSIPRTVGKDVLGHVRT